MCISLDMIEDVNGYCVYCPSHSLRIMESTNAMFIENDWTDQTRIVVLKNDHTEKKKKKKEFGLKILLNSIH